MKLHEIISKSAKGLEISPGINGPYNDPQTDVRNNAHWSITYLHLGKEKEATKCLNKVISGRPFNKTFFMRNKKGKTRCNGLMGQARVIEALVHAHEKLRESRYDELAKEVFLMHKQTKSGYWKRRDIDGKELSVDKTFNHQLWFAAAGSMIPNEEIRRQIIRFMDRLENNISIHKNGLIRHLIWPKITTPVHLIKSKKTPKYLHDKEVGYHAFNLYGLALLKEKLPDHSFWNSMKFSKILNYALSKEHLDIAEKNKYGTQYNPSGIELAYFVYVLRDRIDDWKSVAKQSLERQFAKHLDKKTSLMNQNTNDPDTLAARIYEATRLPDIELDL